MRTNMDITINSEKLCELWGKMLKENKDDRCIICGDLEDLNEDNKCDYCHAEKL